MTRVGKKGDRQIILGISTLSDIPQGHAGIEEYCAGLTLSFWEESSMEHPQNAYRSQVLDHLGLVTEKLGDVARLFRSEKVLRPARPNCYASPRSRPATSERLSLELMRGITFSLFSYLWF